VLALVSIGWFTVFAARMVINTLLPEIKEAYVLTNSQAGLIVTFLGITYAVMQFPSGLVADFFGEAKMLTVVLFGTALVTLGLGAAPTFWVFVPATILFGAITGSYYTVSTSLLSQVFPGRRGWALGIQSSVGSFSGVVAPMIASLVVSISLGWRTAFFFAGGFCLATGIALYAVHREVGTLIGSDSVPGKDDDASKSTETENGFFHQFRDVLYRFANGYILMLTVLYSLLMFVRWGIDAFFTIYVTESKGLSLVIAGGLFGMMYAVGIVVKPIAGELADRVGERLVITGCIALQTGSLFLFVFARSALMIVATVLLFSVGLMGFPAVLQSHFLTFIPEAERGSAFGMYRSTYLLVASASPAVIGTVADMTSLNVMLLILVGLSAAGLVVFVLGYRLISTPAWR
jgi:sugar phosphate permease